MRAIQLITTVACFAAVALAVPSPAKKAEQEAHLFKRGEPLTPEDLSLAEMHSVNTTEMYKHSVIRRRGEEEITIWVDNSFTESRPEPNPSLADRTVHTKHPYNYWGGSNREQCFRVKHHGDTGPNAPCTGGIREIKNWAANNGGYFKLVKATTAWRTLLVAGTNSDCNGRFRAQRQYKANESGSAQMGNVDIYDIVKKSLDRYTMTFKGRDRVRAYGAADCGEFQTPLNWQIRRWGHRV